MCYKVTHGLSDSVPENTSKNFHKLNIPKVLYMLNSTVYSKYYYMNMCQDLYFLKKLSKFCTCNTYYISSFRYILE